MMRARRACAWKFGKSRSSSSSQGFDRWFRCSEMEWEIVRHPQPHLLSAQEFSSHIEARNIPVVFESSVTSWPAYSKWQPRDGGLDYLKSIASDVRVQVMLSSSDGNFYGDVRSHERMALSFGEYLDYASRFMNSDKKDKQSSESHRLDGMQLYLAQMPILSKEQQESSPLQTLLQDIIMPKYLHSSSITNINLWLSAVASNSSTHYDPFHNVLCVLSGVKKVTLWPPCATPFLYPYPVYGEASNHSAVDFVKPNTRLHPHFEQASKYSRQVTLQQGDALFIPEGWYHQVNSDSLTIGVNLWWPSMIMSTLGSHMDGYYLRRVVSSLLDYEKERIIGLLKIRRLNTAEVDESIRATEAANSKRIESQSSPEQLVKKKENDHPGEAKQHTSIDSLTPLEKHCLKNVILACTSQDTSLDMDVIAEVFSRLDPLSLKQLLSNMVLHFPKTLEMLVLYKLSPMAAELLTRRFDEMDKLCSEAEQAQFYESFYKVFEDPKMAMSSFLDGKETFAAEALQYVLANYLGLSQK